MLSAITFLLFFSPTILGSSFSIKVLNQTGTHCSPSGRGVVTSTNQQNNIVHSMPEFLPYNEPGSMETIHDRTNSKCLTCVATQRGTRSECVQFIRINTDRQNRIVLNQNGTTVSAWGKITEKEFLDISTRYQWVEDTGFEGIGGGVYIAQGPILGRIDKQFGAAEATSYCGGGLLKVTWGARVTTNENMPAGPPDDSVDQSWKFTHRVGYAVCNE
ncbi:hypothetical protein DM02DRAFT_625142 [Periconia macrospinosa]|uniref:Ecp2 effector protein domain-containing protein n=1 Tax=Periconia macrospinosa TaxID=97972 RepID=A0A2V1E103_9PLEO|nr:hypothetical protein DM02DRAFT_625142 [Periconia macrospinosa]